MTASCVICERADAGTAYGCTACATRTAERLATVADLASAARAVAAGLTRRGTAVGGSGGGGRLPFDLGATARLDAAQNAITTWARHVAGERGHQLPVAGDPLEAGARWLVPHVEWLRHRAEVVEFDRDVAAVARVIAATIDGPGDRRWLGQCGAATDDGDCPTDLHARADAATATCRTCGTTAVVATRRAELGRLVRGYSYSASEIAAAYPHVKATRVRKWAERGRIVATGEYDGRPVYDLGEVLDRAAIEDARRAALAAKRAADQEERDAEEAMSGAA